MGVGVMRRERVNLKNYNDAYVCMYIPGLKSITSYVSLEI